VTVALNQSSTDQAYERLNGAVRVVLGYPDMPAAHMLRILRRAYVDAGKLARGDVDPRMAGDSYGRHHVPHPMIECHDPPLRLTSG
jgi:hypothetical protein